MTLKQKFTALLGALTPTFTTTGVVGSVYVDESSPLFGIISKIHGGQFQTTFISNTVYALMNYINECEFGTKEELLALAPEIVESVLVVDNTGLWAWGSQFRHYVQVAIEQGVDMNGLTIDEQLIAGQRVQVAEILNSLITGVNGLGVGSFENVVAVA